ncbi:MAG: hypothetical protein JTT11_00015 [Candidatus Brockarchaeota archaeon]|nr:hypothetical protein [Candidatus Brockarchaeota archaeon]
MEVGAVMYSLLPLLSLIVPFFAGVLCLFTYPFRFLEPFSKRIEKVSLLFGTGLTLVTVLSSVQQVFAGEPLETPILSLRVDLTNAAAVLGVSSIFFITSLYNVKAERGGRLKASLYNFFVMLLLFCMLGLTLSYDLFGIFLFVELTIGASIVLVVHAPGKSPPEAAFKYLIITSISALFVLLGVLMIYISTGTSNLFDIMGRPDSLAGNPRLTFLAAACFVIGFGADIGLVPFHGWVPDVFPASTPAVNSFSCAEPIALVFALYKMLHLLHAILPSPAIVTLAAGTGIVSMVFGALLAYPQRDFMRMIAYCSIDEFGHMVFALSLFTPQSFTAGMMYLVNGALMKSGVLQGLGSVLIARGTSDMDSLGGLVGGMKKTSVGYAICVLSLVGVPPLSGFHAKWLLYNATYEYLLHRAGISASIAALALLACISMVSFVFLVRSFHRIFLGRSLGDQRNVAEVHWTMWLPTAATAAIAVAVGLQPNLLLGLVRPP